MKCVLCGGKTSKKTIPYKELDVLFGEFPADVCDNCGEQYFDEKTVDKIQQKSKQLGLFGLAKKAKVAEVGNSIAIRIPKNIAQFLKLEKGKEVVLLPKSKHDLHIEI